MKVHYNELYSLRSSEIIKKAKQGKNLVIDFTNICALGASCLDRLRDLLPLKNVRLVNISSFILKQFDEFLEVNYYLADVQTRKVKCIDYQKDEFEEQIDVITDNESDDGTIQLTFF